MRFITLQSPAKLNLFLKVVGRRKDGYHELVTIFHRISLADTLTLRKKKSGFHLTCSNPKLSSGEDNLITRAYRELKKEIPRLGGVAVHLKKRIPMGGGLGGGSGNAGAFLLGMKRLYGLKVPEKKLMRIGSRLGADVAFFVQNTAQAIGKGVGDQLRKFPNPARHFFVLSVSDQPLSTPAVYRALPKKLPAVNLTRVNRVARLLLSSLGKRDYKKAQILLQNDLETPAFRLRPEIVKTLQRMQRSGLTAVRMSGSGPTVFGIARSEKQANAIAQKLNCEDSSRRYVICCSF